MGILEKFIGEFTVTVMIMNEQVVVAFCENGRGFGGAAISLQTYLKAHSPWVKPLIITGRADGEYAGFAEYGIWSMVNQSSSFEAAAKHYLGAQLGSIADNLFNLLPTALKFARLFVKHKVDLVYLNNDLYCNLAAALGACLVRKPIMLHLRGFCESSHSSRWAAGQLVHLAYISEAIKQNALQFAIPEQRMSWIPEGIDVVYFAQGDAMRFKQALSINVDSPVITLVGGLVGWKGQDVLIDAAPLILKQFPNAIFLLVGGAYSHFIAVEQQLRTQIARLNLQGSVLMLGDRNDLADILAASDMVIHASTLPEPLGRTVIEGMAAGRAVIAANEGGPLDVIKDGVDGLLIAPRNSELLANTICRLLADPDLRQQLGASAMMSAQKFSVANHVRYVESAITKALNAQA